MKNGQISLDLLLTIIVVIIVVTSFAFVSQSTRQSQDIMIAQSQLKEISSKTAAFITTTKTISDTNYYIELKINKIRYTDSKGNNKSAYPQIKILDGNKLITLLEIDGVTLDANDYFSKSKNTNINVDEVKTIGKMVISNA